MLAQHHTEPRFFKYLPVKKSGFGAFGCCSAIGPALKLVDH